VIYFRTIGFGRPPSRVGNTLKVMAIAPEMLTRVALQLAPNFARERTRHNQAAPPLAFLASPRGQWANPVEFFASPL